MRDNTSNMFMKEVGRLQKKIENYRGSLELGRRCGDKLQDAEYDLDDVYRVYREATGRENRAEDYKTAFRHVRSLFKQKRYDELAKYLKDTNSLL